MELNSPPSASLQRYVVAVPNSSLRELLWTADFHNFDRTLAIVFRARELWSAKLQLPWYRRIHYDALLILAIRGAETVVAELDDNAAEKFDLAAQLLSIFEDGDPQTVGCDSVMAQVVLTLHTLGLEIPDALNDSVPCDLNNLDLLRSKADLPLSPHLMNNPPK